MPKTLSSKKNFHLGVQFSIFARLLIASSFFILLWQNLTECLNKAFAIRTDIVLLNTETTAGYELTSISNLVSGWTTVANYTLSFWMKPTDWESYSDINDHGHWPGIMYITGPYTHHNWFILPNYRCFSTELTQTSDCH